MNWISRNSTYIAFFRETHTKNAMRNYFAVAIATEIEKHKNNRKKSTYMFLYAFFIC